MSELYKKLTESIRAIPVPIMVSLSLIGLTRILTPLYTAIKFRIDTGKSPINLPERYGKGSWVVITGAADGIGKSWATQFAALGFNTFLIDISPTTESVATEIQTDFHVSAKFLIADLQEESSFTRIMDSVSGLDVSILVNNAGVLFPCAFEDSDDAKTMQQINVNLIAVMELTKRFLPLLKSRQNRSALIFMSSVSGKNGFPFASVYSATKGFVRCFALSLSEELKGEVDVLSVEPFIVCTAMTNYMKLRRAGATPDQVTSGALVDLGREISTGGSVSHKYMSLRAASTPLASQLSTMSSFMKKQMSKFG